MLWRRRVIVISAGLAVLLTMPWMAPTVALAESPGEVYRRIDRHGVTSFTNVPSDDGYTRIDLATVRLRSRLPIHELEGTIARHSRRHRLDPALISAVIKAESDFDPDAVSKAGAIGLMQLMPETAETLDIRDPFDPEENIAGGVRYLRYLIDRFHGNLPLALAAYNAGATRVEQYRTLPPIPETRRYVKKVLRFYRQFGERRISQIPIRSLSSSSPSWPRAVASSALPNP